MEPFPVSQLLDATHGRVCGPLSDEQRLTRICTDSRTLRAGDLFWALRGERHDGHNFVQQALEQGAVAAVVDHEFNGEVRGSLIQVPDTLSALGDLARWYRHQRESLVVGVTGSVGKTSTREMIHSVLSSRHTGVQSFANYNNLVGLPLSILNLEDAHEFGVFELGAARAGDIRALCEIVYPEVGVLTRVGIAHLETFGSQEAIYRGKCELLESLPAHGFAVVGGDDELLRQHAQRAVCQPIFVGEKPGNQVRATEIEVTPQRLKFTVDRKKYEVPVSARHYLTAALCAIAVGREIGMDTTSIAQGLMNFRGQPGRFKPESIGPWTVIDDTYNANPTSMQAACASLADFPNEHKRLFIAGDMLELGESARDLHEQLGRSVAERGIEGLLVFGNFAADVARGAISGGMSRHQIAHCPSLETLWTVLDCWLEPGDTVLVKGSRGVRMERVIDWMRQQCGMPAHPRQAA